MRLFGVDHRPWPNRLRWLAFLTGVWLVGLMMFNQYLVTPEAPQGIVSYQLAGEPDTAKAIQRSWGGEGRRWVQTSLILDYVFIALYLTFLISLTNHFLVDRPGVREQQMGKLVRVLFVVGAIADGTENAFLLRTIADPDEAFWPMAATLCTLIKFSGLLLGAAALLIVRASRRHPLEPEHQGTSE